MKTAKMNSNTKSILAITGATVVGGILLTKILKTNSLYKNFEVLPDISVHNIGFDGVVINANAKIVNSSNGSVKLRKPTIKLWNEDKTKLLGISDAYQDVERLESWSSLWFKNIRINIPLLSLPSNVLTLLKDGYLKMIVETILTVEGVTISKEETVELTARF
ncbi:hypothetical protein ACE193_15255 [Bernardetia sp. OM2101]|uniref:hypothetical protein n=1 Tax=Bernardetia sp. OM2101 TaxID=3344876 RepID=UPI0035CE9BAE